MSLLLPLQGATTISIDQFFRSGQSVAGVAPTGLHTQASGRNVFAYEEADNVTPAVGGLVYFEQTEPILVSAIYTAGAPGDTGYVYLVNLTTGGVPIPGERWRVNNFSFDSGRMFFSSLVLLKHQALQFVSDAPLTGDACIRALATLERASTR